VDPRPNSFFAVEVALQPELFDKARHGAERNAQTFYASWQNGPLLQAGQYTLPADVWARLISRNPDADTLCYRIWTSASATSWTSIKPSTADADAAGAPGIQITEARVSSLTDPGVLVLHRVPSRQNSGGNVSAPVLVTYTAQNVQRYSRVVILPDAVAVQVEVAQ